MSNRVLDLHGKSRLEARLAVKEFLCPLSNSPSEENVELITGRGLHSVGGKAVIQEEIAGLLNTLPVKVTKTNKGGALNVTIPAETELILSDDERCDKQALFHEFCQAQLKLKGASSSNAQALVSHSGKYIEEGMDDVVGMINAFAQVIRCRVQELFMPIENDIFGEENKKYRVLKQDLIDFCEMKTVADTLISMYMRYLYDKYEKSCKIIEFFNPASISKRLERRKNSQLCFIPCYNIQSKFHWVLMVIDCSSMIVYWVDFLDGEPDELTKLHVKNGLSPLRGGDTPWPPTWRIIRGPTQTDCVQSGYCVMKLMRELMDDPSQSIKMKMERLICREGYTLEDFNVEWSSLIILKNEC